MAKAAIKKPKVKPGTAVTPVAYITQAEDISEVCNDQDIGKTLEQISDDLLEELRLECISSRISGGVHLLIVQEKVRRRHNKHKEDQACQM